MLPEYKNLLALLQSPEPANQRLGLNALKYNGLPPKEEAAELWDYLDKSSVWQIRMLHAGMLDFFQTTKRARIAYSPWRDGYHWRSDGTWQPHKFPNQVWKLDFLQDLRLSFGYLSLHSKGLSQPNLERLANLETLDLFNNAFRNVPPAVFGLQRLRHLGLGRTSLLATGMRRFSQLTQIETLDLSSLRQADALLSNLVFPKQIRALRLSEARIRVFPKSLLSLEHLEVLWLDGNFLGSLPNLFDYMPKLRHLNISNNFLKEIPDWLEANRARLVHLYQYSYRFPNDPKPPAQFDGAFCDWVSALL